MSLDEAYLILNLPKEDKVDLQEVEKKYGVMFGLNDPEKGGSLYIASKIVRARERIEMELKKNEEDLGEGK